MAIWIVLPILTLLMFDLGLTLRLEDFSKVFRRPWPLAVAMVGQLVLLPSIALGLHLGLPSGTGVFYRTGLDCLLPGRQLFQCILQACRRGRGAFRDADCHQQCGDALHHSPHHELGDGPGGRKRRHHPAGRKSHQTESPADAPAGGPRHRDELCVARGGQKDGQGARETGFPAAPPCCPAW